MEEKLVIGMDFGTDSARGLLVNSLTGEVLNTSVSNYKRWAQGLYCNPQREEYRQHPLDYIEAIDDVFDQLFRPFDRSRIKNVVAIGTNTTGSTPVAVNEECVPLALTSGFEDNPNAMFILWKDHSAKREAEEINQLAKLWSVDYTLYSGGIYSSEWFWSKILHTNRVDKSILDHSFTWLEQSDWIPAYFVGVNRTADLKCNRCAAGHKAMWNDDHGGLPSSEFLVALDGSFSKIASRFYDITYTSDEVYGNISTYFVEKYGFDPNTKVTVGGIDAHHGAVGVASEPYSLVKVVGTSTCDMLVIPKTDNPPLVAGICGQVDGSIDPDMIGFEAGQSAFGDIFNWFKKLVLKPTYSIIGDSITDKQKENLEQHFFDYVTKEANLIPLNDDNLVFTDYFNGRRTPDADFMIKATGSGFTLSTEAGHFYKALVESTAFGSKAIIERFKQYQIPIKSVIAVGGIPKKSPYVVQVMSDILGCDIHVVDSDQICALGSAIFASVAAGVYENMENAKAILAAKITKTYKPNSDNQKIYQHLYNKYQLISQP